MTRDDLGSPLLPPRPSDEPELVLRIDDDQPSDEMPHRHQSSSHQRNQSHGPSTHLNSHNPYSFLNIRGFTVPPSSTINPFRNRTFRIEGVYEWLKIVLCVPIALIRIVLFGVCLVVGFLATKIALQGWKDTNNPMPKWRSRIMWVTRVSARCILFCFGYQWIRRKGRPAPREVAPIVVSNHVSYIEPIFYFYELFPTIVASESHDSIPVVGTIIRAMQVIYVNRLLSSSRKHAVREIKRKASCGKFPRVLLFPEGTTTNGKVIISFQNGAFIAGYPIQPVVVRYPHVHFDQSWGHIALAKLMLRMFTQFHNFMEVEYLPVIVPPENQKESALQFSKRTSHAIATALNVAQTSHSYGDLMLITHAQSKHEEPSHFLVEMARVESIGKICGESEGSFCGFISSDKNPVKESLHISTAEAVEFLDKFLSMNPDPSGCAQIQDFLRVLRLKPCALSEKIFGFIDVEKNGKITYKQFLFGSGHVRKQPLFGLASERAFMESVAREKNYISLQELGNSIRSAIPNLDEEEIHDLFNLFDTDTNGKISKDDFTTCLRKNPLLIALFGHHFLQESSAARGGMVEHAARRFCR